LFDNFNILLFKSEFDFIKSFFYEKFINIKKEM